MRSIGLSAILLGITCSTAAAPGGEQALREGVRAALVARIAPAVRAKPPRPDMSEEELVGEIDRVADGLTECTVGAMQDYPKPILDTGYQVMADGGSYPEAKEAMDVAIRVELSAGGERESVMSAAVASMGAELRECAGRMKK
jgi:hypothetical protein